MRLVLLILIINSIPALHFEDIIFLEDSNRESNKLISRIDKFIESDSPEIYLFSSLHDDLREKQKEEKDFKKSQAIQSFRIKAVMWSQNKYFLGSLKKESPLYTPTEIRTKRYKKGLKTTRDYLKKVYTD